MAGRIIPISIFRRGWSIFDDVFHRMAQAESEMEAMRQQMFRLRPREIDEARRGDEKSSSIRAEQEELVDHEGGKKLKLTFGVDQFRPEEIKLKLLNDNVLQVKAEHEKETTSGYVSRIFERRYSLPTGVDVSSIRSTLTKDGQLTVEADLPASQPKTANEKIIDIEHKP